MGVKWWQRAERQRWFSKANEWLRCCWRGALQGQLVQLLTIPKVAQAFCNVKPSAESKVVLVVDGHSTHKSLAAIDYARDNNVIMICLTPHSTHLTQPLDFKIFGWQHTMQCVISGWWVIQGEESWPMTRLSYSAKPTSRQPIWEMP